MKKIKNRYAILAIASIVNFVHGNPYIWTVFQPYVRKEYGLSLAASSQPFTIIIGIFALGNMLGGFLQHKVGAEKDDTCRKPCHVPGIFSGRGGA